MKPRRQGSDWNDFEERQKIQKFLNLIDEAKTQGVDVAEVLADAPKTYLVSSALEQFRVNAICTFVFVDVLPAGGLVGSLTNQAYPVLDAIEDLLRPDDDALVLQVNARCQSLPTKAGKFSIKCACNGAGSSRIINYTATDKSTRQSILDGQIASWCRP